MSRPRLVVDFETYYDNEVSTSTLGVRNYTKRAEAYMVSVCGEGLAFCGTVQELAARYPAIVDPDADFEFWAANSNFDHSFWQKYYGPSVRQWKCVLDLAAYHQLPRALDSVTRVVLGRKLDKDVRASMKGVRFETLPADRQQRVLIYCLEDAKATYELLNKLPPMSSLEADLAEHTRLLNRRGLRVDLERVKRDVGLLEDLHFASLKALPWVAAGEAPLSYPAFAFYCERSGVAAPVSLDKRDPRCDEWVKANPALGKLVLSMRTIRGLNTKIEKLKSIALAADDNSEIPLDLLYAGARHTRRWSSKSINVQNLDAKRVFAEEMADLQYFKDNPDEEPGIFMREYFLPPPGKKFGIAARVRHYSGRADSIGSDQRVCSLQVDFRYL